MTGRILVGRRMWGWRMPFTAGGDSGVFIYVVKDNVVMPLGAHQGSRGELS